MLQERRRESTYQELQYCLLLQLPHYCRGAALLFCLTCLSAIQMHIGATHSVPIVNEERLSVLMLIAGLVLYMSAQQLFVNPTYVYPKQLLLPMVWVFGGLF